MTLTSVRIHPVYGPIHKSGEYVQRGAILGVSVDMREAVTAPISGWVRVVAEVRRSATGLLNGVRVEILDEPGATEHIPRMLDGEE